jgi:hypothetical protein
MDRVLGRGSRREAHHLLLEPVVDVVESGFRCPLPRFGFAETSVLPGRVG